MFVFLSVATFFEGYDFTALSQVLPNIRADLGLSPAAGGRLVAAIGLGTILAYIPIRWADRAGRRPVLQVTIVGYALCALLSGLSRSVYDFTAFQLLGRVFLIAEWALSMVYAAEAFPAARRGFVIGVVQSATAFGSIACAAVTPFLLNTHYGWRAVYLVGVVPLLLLAYARRGLPETERFLKDGPAGGALTGLKALWHSPRRTRVLQLAAIWGVTYLCTQNAVVFWKEFAVAERGFSDAAVGRAISAAALVSLPLAFAAGAMLDAWGRRAGAAVIYLALAGGVLGAYQLHGVVPLTAALTLALFAVSAQPAVLNAYTTELFPTAVRGEAFGWSNNLLGRIGYVLGPALVGWAAGSVGWGPAVSGTAVFALVALGLVLWWLPETRGQGLEQTSQS